MRKLLLILTLINMPSFSQDWVIGTIKESGAEMKDSSYNIILSNKDNPDMLKVGDTVKSYSSEGGIISKYLDKMGEIDPRFIEYSSSAKKKLIKQLKANLKELKLKESPAGRELSAKIEKEIKDRHIRIIKEFGMKYADDIINGNIRLGMTEKMVIKIMGEPNNINRTVGKWGVHEQWIYDDKYLYFENNKLTSWQD